MRMNNTIIRQSTTGRRGDGETGRIAGASPRRPVALSPCPPVSPSPRLLVSLSFFLIAVCLIGVSICLPALRAKAQSGALIPVSVKNEPDPSILSLQVMKVDVAIDNQHARVKVLQIFDNHANQVLEGKYLFALPPQSSIADFAVWDGDLRLPGVILEKRRRSEERRVGE